MKRTLASILASAMMLFALAGCAGGNAPADSTNQNDTAEESSQAAEPITISVGVPTAPPALPVLHMMEEQLLGENVTIDLNVWNAPEELLAMVQGGEHDLYAFPLTVISTLYMPTSYMSGPRPTAGSWRLDAEAALHSFGPCVRGFSLEHPGTERTGTAGRAGVVSPKS